MPTKLRNPKISINWNACRWSSSVAKLAMAAKIHSPNGIYLMGMYLLGEMAIFNLNVNYLSIQIYCSINSFDLNQVHGACMRPDRSILKE